jgi:hypothetical protein
MLPVPDTAINVVIMAVATGTLFVIVTVVLSLIWAITWIDNFFSLPAA